MAVFSIVSIVGVLVGVVTIVGILAGVILLEIFLSNKENPWLGLILPILSFLLSLVPTLFIAASSIVQLLPRLLLVVGVANIPTLVLLIVYFICRGRFRKQKQLKKMNIQDLE